VCATIVAVEKQLVLHTLESVYVALGVHHAMRMLHTVVCALPASTVFFFPHYLINGAIIEIKLFNTKCVL